MVTSYTTDVLPQSSFPSHMLDHTMSFTQPHYRDPHSILDSSWDNSQPKAGPSIGIQSRRERTSLPSTSPPRSPTSTHTSSLSSQSLNSMSSSMSPSSIVSLQRIARREKKHACPSPNIRPLSPTTLIKDQSSRQVPPPKQTEKQVQDGQGAAGAAPTIVSESTDASVKSKKRFARWKLSIRQPLSKSNAQPTIDRGTAPKPHGDKTKNTSGDAKPTDAKATDASRSKVATMIGSLSSFFPSSHSSQHSQSRFFKRGLKKKIGSGLITVFCIAAVVILILC
ncbi:hypothetical protein B0O80DRAFT_457012 [Mortierella sp. GBAus27b]|nr:hypothetical protein B0O80DRAFT_457012 [Mortierella sp. GBAus27b]